MTFTAIESSSNSGRSHPRLLFRLRERGGSLPCLALALAVLWPQPRQVEVVPDTHLSLPIEIVAPPELAAPATLLRRELTGLFGPAAVGDKGEPRFGWPWIPARWSGRRNTLSGRLPAACYCGRTTCRARFGPCTRWRRYWGNRAALPMATR